MGQIIDGKSFAKGLRGRIAAQVSALRGEHHVTPGLAVVLVGDNPASHVYVRNKAKQATETGMNLFEHRFDDSMTETSLLRLIAQLNEDPRVNGMLVQLPLPGHIDSEAILMAIDPAKDVDGFHPLNVGSLAVGRRAMVPCTPLGCMMLLRDLHADLTGMEAVIVGRSNIVGKPMATLLLRENCTVTMTHSRTRDLAGECRRADILVAAVGQPRLIKGDWIKPGSTVIDVGINRIETDSGKTRLVGDVDFESAKDVAGAITPVPGGVGPMTIASLLANTLIATCRQKKIEEPEL